jgi:hypothetical protein
MPTRTTTRKSRAKPVDHIEPIDVESTFVEPVAPTWFESMRAALGEGTGASWKRIAATAVACFFVGAGIGYIAAPIISVLTLMALSITGSAFIAICIYFLGVLATLFASYQVGGIVARSILTGNVDIMAKSAFNSVRGFFAKRSDEVAT